MCSSAWAEPGKPGGVSSPPTLKFSSTVTTGASALRTMTTCKPLDSVARVTLLGSAACKRVALAENRTSKDNRALNFTSISPRRILAGGSSLSWLGYARLPEGSLQRHYIDSDLQAVFGAAEQNSANGADIAVIPAPRQGDVAVGRHTVVGGVEVHPSEAGAPGRTPGVGSIGSHQAGTAGWGNGTEISADIPCRQPQRSHTGDLQMGKVLANSAAFFKEGFDRCGHLGRLGVKAEILIDAGGEIENCLEQRAFVGKRFAGVGGQIGLGGDTDGVKDELVSL